jgi:octaprenyl-diphosphate synthase
MILPLLHIERSGIVRNLNWLDKPYLQLLAWCMSIITTNLEDIRAPVLSDLKAVDQLILAELNSKIPLINEVTAHLLKNGGKRLRPLVLLLCARALGYEQDTEHQEVAAVLEFMHNATLLHDDVVDESKLRRGEYTANALWGNQTSILVGDFLYSRAFLMLARRSNIPVMNVFAKTTNIIAEGEILQLMNRHQADIDESTYFSVINSKTAELFAAASEIAALISPQAEKFREPMRNYGLHLGLGFQIIDDVLDYTADPEVLGKNLGDDLSEGKITLPLIYAKKQGNFKQKKLISDAIETGGLDHFEGIIQAIKETNALSYCLNIARAHIQSAAATLDALPHSHYKEALENLLEFVLERSY